MRQATQKDIARKARISRAAVSLTLNKRASIYRIKPKTQRRILHISKKLGYSKNIFGSCLRARKSNLIGIIGAAYNVPIRQIRQNLIAQYFKDRGFRVFLQDFHWAEDKIGLIREIEELRPEGLIVAEPEPDAVIEYLATVRRKGVPVVLVDGPKVKGFEQVRIDRKKAVYSGVKHLFDQDCKEVFLTMPSEFSYWAMAERFQGFRQAYEDFGVGAPAEKHLVWNGQGQYSDSFFLGYQIGRMFNFPDKGHSVGIMTLNDQVAIGLTKAFLEREIRIPEDIGQKIYPKAGLPRFL